MLIFSASSSFITPVTDFVESFLSAINYGDLDATVVKCGDATNNAGVAALKLFTREIFDDPQAILNAFGESFAQATLYCGQATAMFPEMLNYIQSGFKNLTVQGFSYNVARNSLTLNKYFNYFRYASYKGMHADMGELLADMIKIMVFGQEQIPARRILAQIDNLEIADFALGESFKSLFEGADGFFNDKLGPQFAKITNQTNQFIDSLANLEKALISQNIDKILNASKVFYDETINSINKIEPATKQIVESIGEEITEIVKRDVAEVTQGVEKLLDDIPASVGQIQKMVTDFEKNEVKEFGKSIRDMYNRIFGGIIGKNWISFTIVKKLMSWSLHRKNELDKCTTWLKICYLEPNKIKYVCLKLDC